MKFLRKARNEVKENKSMPNLLLLLLLLMTTRLLFPTDVLNVCSMVVDGSFSHVLENLVLGLKTFSLMLHCFHHSLHISRCSSKSLLDSSIKILLR